MFKRLVDGLEIVALVVAVVFLGLMVGYRPTRPTPVRGAGSGVTGAVSSAADIGAEVFAANCASCHGARGEGDFGPRLGGGAAVTHFPTAEGEVGVVTNGRGSMPAWRGRLTPAQIQAVVDYTRTRL